MVQKPHKSGVADSRSCLLADRRDKRTSAAREADENELFTEEFLSLVEQLHEAGYGSSMPFADQPSPEHGSDGEQHD